MVINIIKDNKSDSKQPVVYDLGTVTSTLQALLDVSKITITDKQVILLKVTQLDTTVSYYFLPFRDYNGNSLYGYGKEIVVADLIPIGGGGGAVTTPTIAQVLAAGNSAIPGQQMLLQRIGGGTLLLNAQAIQLTAQSGSNMAINGANLIFTNVLSRSTYLNGNNATSDVNLNLPNADAITPRTLVASINGNYADTTGNVTIAAGGGTWGSITGTLSAQTDLQNALNAKQDNLTAANVHTYVDSLTSLTTPVDADRMIIVDNSASLAKKITWTNIKATLKTYFDGFYSSKQPGSFSGTFALDSLGGNFYNDLTQVGALTFTAGGSAIVGGSDCVKITANGSAITIPGTFINVGGESISIVNGAINRITVIKTASEIWYTVKVN